MPSRSGSRGGRSGSWPARLSRVLDGKMLRLLLAPSSQLAGADVVLQRAVVRRYAELRAPGAGRWHRRWAVQAGLALPRRAFRPPPRADSAVLVVRRR